jgi:hypothetical protein
VLHLCYRLQCALFDKGNVEGLVGYAGRNFMVPVPRVASWVELNAQLPEECRKRRERKPWGHQETIAERFERDREKLLPLPPAPFIANPRYNRARRDTPVTQARCSSGPLLTTLNPPPS